jgi:hypothetical protein
VIKAGSGRIVKHENGLGIRQLVAIGRIAFDCGAKRSATLESIGSSLFPVKWVE